MHKLIFPGQNGHHSADNFLNVFFFNEKFCILMQISLKLFRKVQLTISEHRFRQWRGAEQATSHYLNQC